tara:strand:+ start:1330 stop:2466 length:1137 start_codon:yes stop_codon:yes gene_type:complete
MNIKDLSSIGFGLYRGEESDKGDEKWIESLLYGLDNGINTIDTAQKYRNGRSEKVVGQVVNKLIGAKKIKRDNLFISTKAGLLPNYIIESDHLLKIGVNKKYINYEQKFCMDPTFIDWSVDKALEAMDLNYLDGFLLHNPEIAMLFDNGEERILECLKVLEQKAIDGKIKFYGLATWNGLRREPKSKLHIDLLSIIKCINEYFGKNHFKIIEAPLSIGMPTILSYHSSQKNNTNLQEIIKKNKLIFLSSASLYEGHINELIELNKLFGYINQSDSPNEDKPAKVSFPESENSLKQLFELLINLKNSHITLSEILKSLEPKKSNLFNAALNIVRSTEFVSCALVGMENIKYTKENVQILRAPKIDNKILEEYWIKSWKN